MFIIAGIRGMSIAHVEFMGGKIWREAFDTTQKAPGDIVGRVPAPYVRPASCQRRTKAFPLRGRW